MKAISLYEPWGTLIALGKKRYETRSWSTTYRGSLLICASKKRPPLSQIIGILYYAGITLNELNPGRAVAFVDLTDIYPADDLLQVDRFYGLLEENEKFYGDFSPGRFAWKLENIRRIKNPPPIKGKQGLFDVDDFYKTLDTYDPI
jgi:hypothetical protein